MTTAERVVLHVALMVSVGCVACLGLGFLSGSIVAETRFRATIAQEAKRAAEWRQRHDDIETAYDSYREMTRQQLQLLEKECGE